MAAAADPTGCVPRCIASGPRGGAAAHPFATLTPRGRAPGLDTVRGGAASSLVARARVGARGRGRAARGEHQACCIALRRSDTRGEECSQHRGEVSRAGRRERRRRARDGVVHRGIARAALETWRICPYAGRRRGALPHRPTTSRSCRGCPRRDPPHGEPLNRLRASSTGRCRLPPSEPRSKAILVAGAGAAALAFGGAPRRKTRTHSVTGEIRRAACRSRTQLPTPALVAGDLERDGEPARTRSPARR